MLDKNLEEILANLEHSFKELEESQIWKNVVMKSFRLTDQTFKQALDEFKATCMVAMEERNTNELMRYFSHWYPKNKERLSKGSATPPKRL